MIEVLLELDGPRGLDVQNFQGEAPIHMASELGDDDKVALLVRSPTPTPRPACTAAHVMLDSHL